jgi:hypothetical protein
VRGDEADDVDDVDDDAGGDDEDDGRGWAGTEPPGDRFQ